MIARRQILKSAAGAAAPLLARHASRPRNVLLLIADDLGLHTGEYGDRTAKTPNLDRLAREGVRFTNAFCTTASCSACRSVIMSGLHNHANGQYGHAHDFHNQSYLPSVRPLARVLKDAGHRTGLIGKLHVNPPSAFPWDFSPPGNQRSVYEMAQSAKQFIRSAAGRPWYLHVGYGDPHRAAAGFGNEAYSGVTPNPFDPARVAVPSFLPDNIETRREVAEYYQAANRLDQGIGFMLDVLRETGELENTLIMFFSDNGMAFPNAKTNCYDAGIHMPLIVRSPTQQRRGLANDAMVSFVDLFPTIVEWAGARMPDYPVHGRSFLPVLEQESPSGWDRIFISHTFHEMTMYYPMRGMRNRRYKYIRNLYPELTFPHSTDLWASATWQSVLKKGKEGRIGKRGITQYLHRPGEELYDIGRDPDEVSNLASDPGHRSVLEAMRTEVGEFRRRTGDPWLVNETYIENQRGL